MIVDAFFGMLAALIDGLHDLLPDWDITPGTLGGQAGVNWGYDSFVISEKSPMEGVISWAARFNDFVPVDQAILILSTSVAFYSAFLAYRFARFVAGMVRGAGTS